MKNRHKLFTRVEDYYSDLVYQLQYARQSISMTCLAFEDGAWPRRIADALTRQAARGIQVRLMVDQLGQISDEPRNLLFNHRIIAELRSKGIQVDVFRPIQPGLSIRNRMHCKFCAIDDNQAYIGGSNVGDYYTTWSDTNLRVDGELGNTFHETYDHLHKFAMKDEFIASNEKITGLTAGSDQLLLTIPGRHLDIRQALLDLIRQAEGAIYLRSWYFLPDAEIMDALCSQVARGVRVNVLLSHRTRVRPVDLANVIQAHRLVCAGGNVHRFTRCYMHAKVAWNEQGTVLLGSANLDAHSMASNFESCLLIQDGMLARELQKAFIADLSDCLRSTRQSYPAIPLPGRMLSQACNLVSPWL